MTDPISVCRQESALPAQPKTCLVTGVAGFIGSNLLETPLALDQTVVGLDHFATVHRRCFNVFGPRQDPAGAYAAVSPKPTAALLAGAEVFINGDGETSRDVCDIDNTVQANLPAATVGNPAAVNQVYTVAVGERTTLNGPFEAIRETRAPRFPRPREIQPHDRNFRPGDGLAEAMDWSVEVLGGDQARELINPGATSRDGCTVALLAVEPEIGICHPFSNLLKWLLSPTFARGVAIGNLPDVVVFGGDDGSARGADLRIITPQPLSQPS